MLSFGWFPSIVAHDVRLHAYADDTQLYLKCHVQEVTTAAHTLKACIPDVATWMNMTDSSLMPKKQSYSGLGPNTVLALLGSSGPLLQLGAETIKASDHVRLH